MGKPMSEIAPKGSYVAGGVRFYLPVDCSQFVKVERERERAAAQRGKLLYRCLYDRIVIRRKVQTTV